MNNEFLPDDLPSNPLPLFVNWMQFAREHAQQPNPDAMTLATVDHQNKPDARIVLCKKLSADDGYVVFYTNYHSRKAHELSEHPYASAVIHWDGLHRQVRLTGPVLRSPVAESDAYFNRRPVASQLGAWASQQSEPLASRAQLVNQLNEATQHFSLDGNAPAQVPRPPHWGGYRLWIENIELWIEGPGRVHDRARWSRKLTAKDEFSFSGGAWQATRLNP